MPKKADMPQQSELAEAIRFCFRSVNVTDSHGEPPANIVDALDGIATAIYELAEAVKYSNYSNSIGESQ